MRDEWRRVRSGWSAVCDDARRLVTGLRRLQGEGACETGYAHLAGHCRCVRANASPGPPPPDCVVLLHVLRWTLDTVLDDALHVLDVSTLRRVSGTQTVEFSDDGPLREAFLGVAQIVHAIEATAFGLRVRCRPELLRALKDLGEVLLVRVNLVVGQVDRAALEAVES